MKPCPDASGRLFQGRPFAGLRPSGQWGLIAGLVLALLRVASCASGTLASREVYDWRPAASRLHGGGSIGSEVDRLARPLIVSGETDGIAVGVSVAGRSRFFGFGHARDGESGIPDAGSIFQVGSVTKLFVWRLLSILVDEGALRYDETVREILPPSVALSPDAGSLTVRELALHMAGLPREPFSFAQINCFIDYELSGRNLYRCITRKYLYRYLSRLRIEPKTRRQFCYSNLGGALVAHLIEVKTGRTVAKLIDEKICRPLRLKDTAFVLSTAQKARLVSGHAGDQPWLLRRHTPLAPWDMGEFMSGSGALYSTPADLLVFAKSTLALVNSPVDPISRRRKRFPIRTSEDAALLGWRTDHFDNGRVAIAYKVGLVAGYESYVGLDLARQIAVVVLCSNFNWNDKIGHNLILRLAKGGVWSRQSERHKNRIPTS